MDLFTAKNCDRCSGELTTRKMSWFTEETICKSCSIDEQALRNQLPNSGREYEGCGYIPKVKGE